MEVHLKEHQQEGWPTGLLVHTGPRAFSASEKTYFVDGHVIGGICSELVQGRDLEDGLAPLYPIASIIEHALGLNGSWVPDDRRDPVEFEKPPYPGWLGGDWKDEKMQAIDDGRGWRAEATPEQEAEWDAEFDLRPMVVAVASLEMFGGEDKEVVLHSVEPAVPA